MRSGVLMHLRGKTKNRLVLQWFGLLIIIGRYLMAELPEQYGSMEISIPGKIVFGMRGLTTLWRVPLLNFIL